MLQNILFYPPAAFIIILLAVAVVSKLLGTLASGTRDDQEDAKKSYACGENFDGNFIQPDYSQFFPFAFFFTVLHVVALVITTVPAMTVGIFAMAAIYLFAAITGLLILLRK